MVSQSLFDVVSKALFQSSTISTLFYGVKGANVHLKCKGTSEDGAQENSIPADNRSTRRSERG